MELKAMQIDVCINDDLVPKMKIKLDEDFKKIVFNCRHYDADFGKEILMAFIENISLGICDAFEIDNDKFKNYFIDSKGRCIFEITLTDLSFKNEEEGQ